MLLIDLGTNGEMALGNRQKLYACATAAGPAFEGGANRGIWGADMVKLLQKLLEEGLMDRQGLLKEPYFTKGIRIGDVLVTKEAVRAVQLAKGAIAAGIEILTESYGIRLSDISKVVLAGGFGFYLKEEDAIFLRMFPECFAGKIKLCGNTSLQGTIQCSKKMDALQAFAQKIQTVDLSNEEAFHEEFIKNINF